MPRPLRIVIVALLIVAIGVTVVATVRLVARSDDPVVARVGSWELTEGQLGDDLEAIADNVLYTQVRERAGGPTELQRDDGSWDPVFVAEVLTDAVQFQLAHQAVDARGAQITTIDRDNADRVIEAFLGDTTQLVDGSRAQVFLDQFGDFRTTIADGLAALQSLQRLALAEADADEVVGEMFAELDPPELMYCVSVFVFVDLDAAESARSELAEGAELGDVVSAYAPEVRDGDTDPNLGCAVPERLGPELSSLVQGLDVGEIAEPLELEWGPSIVLLEDRSPATVDDAPATVSLLEEQVPAAVLAREIKALGRSAEVWIDPDYGQWDPELTQVVPVTGSVDGMQLVPAEDP